jgi:hypothetical protein
MIVGEDSRLAEPRSHVETPDTPATVAPQPRGVAPTALAAKNLMKKRAVPYKSATVKGLLERRLLGIFPNNRTSPNLANCAPLSRGAKFEIACQDSFDRGTIFLRSSPRRPAAASTKSARS